MTATGMHEYEFGTLGEFEGEEFFGRAWNWIKQDGSPQRKAALWAARKALSGGLGAAGAAAGSLGGPVGSATGGGLGYGLGTYLGTMLPQKEYEDEFEGEFEDEFEFESEHEWELNPVRRVYPDALMEHLGAAAAEAESEDEAEAFLAALVPLAMKAAPLAAKLAPKLLKAAPQVMRGVGQVAKLLRGSPATKPLVRAMPTIVQRTMRDLARPGNRGSVTPQRAAHALARQTYRVLGNPQQRTAALQRSAMADARYHAATGTNGAACRCKQTPHACANCGRRK